MVFYGWAVGHKNGLYLMYVFLLFLQSGKSYDSESDIYDKQVPFESP